MRRFALIFCGCLCAGLLRAADVEVVTAATSDAALRQAEFAIVQRTVARLRRSGVPPKQAVAMARGSTTNETPARALPVAKQFTFKDPAGKMEAAPIVDRYRKDRIVSPVAKSDLRVNPMLRQAASIAQERAHAHSKSRCWRYVKNALLASGIISSYPKTAYAKQAGDELVRDFGFKKLPIRDPYKAPIGAVLVYGSRRAAGHVEIRTKTGFVSDFQNKKPSPRPLIGIYAKA